MYLGRDLLAVDPGDRLQRILGAAPEGSSAWPWPPPLRGRAEKPGERAVDASGREGSAIGRSLEPATPPRSEVGAAAESLARARTGPDVALPTKRDVPPGKEPRFVPVELAETLVHAPDNVLAGWRPEQLERPAKPPK